MVQHARKRCDFLIFRWIRHQTRNFVAWIWLLPYDVVLAYMDTVSPFQCACFFSSLHLVSALWSDGDNCSFLCWAELPRTISSYCCPLAQYKGSNQTGETRGSSSQCQGLAESFLSCLHATKIITLRCSIDNKMEASFFSQSIWVDSWMP